MSDLTLDDIAECFEGAVPAVIATASADGVPNVTYLSRVRLVDGHRVALSNQFFSKTTANLAANPHASVLLLDGRNYEQYRLTLAFERTERRGPVFERLRQDVDIVAAFAGMQDVFRLLAADIYRVVEIEHLQAAAHRRGEPVPVPASGRADGLDAGRIADLGTRLARCGDVGAVVASAMAGLDELFGYRHAMVLLLDDDGRTLRLAGARGYGDEGGGDEWGDVTVALGDGPIGEAAARGVAVRSGGAHQAAKYARSIRRSFEQTGSAAGRDVAAPGLAHSASLLAVPSLALGALIGVVVVEDETPQAFHEADEAVLAVIAAILGGAVEAARSQHVAAPGGGPSVDASGAGPVPVDRVRVRCFARDGSVFLDDEYLVKGVAGRILRSLVDEHLRTGRTEFSNRELRLDATLELPPVKDNLESRLLLLQRRLDATAAPVRIVRTGRGRFRLEVRRPVALDVVAAE